MTGLDGNTVRRTPRQVGARGTARWILALMLAATAGAGLAHAHNIGDSYVYLQVHADTVTGRFEISLKDLNRGFGFKDTEDEITLDTLDDRIGFLERYYLDHVSIEADGRTQPLRFTGHGVLGGGSNAYVQLPFELPELDGVPPSLTIDYSVLFDERPAHRGFVLIEHNWATGTFGNESRISDVFTPGSRRVELDLTSDGVWRGFVGVVGVGIGHIWMGYDHVMFLVALLLPAVLRRGEGGWQEVDRFTPALVNVVKIVTAFTVAHSVTLSLAALDLVRLPEKLVEVAIAASIAIAAADILVPLFRGRVWVVVFGFGLFHGFGFAGALTDMGVLGEHLGLSLLGFNLGVEIGQIAIAAVLFPVLFMLRRFSVYRRLAVQSAAVVMILVSCGWVVERAFDVDVPMYALVKPVVDSVRP